MGSKQEFLKKDPRMYLYANGNDLSRERWREKITAEAKTLRSHKEAGFPEQVEGAGLL